MIRRGFITIGILTAIGLTIILIENFQEEPLHPTVKAILETDFSKFDDGKNNLYYFLGMNSDLSTDFAAQGIKRVLETEAHWKDLGKQPRPIETKHKRLKIVSPTINCGPSYFCNKDQVKEKQKEIEEELRSQRPEKEKFHELVKRGGYGSIAPPHLELSPPIVTYLRWHRHQIIAWSMLAYQGDFEELVTRIVEINDFSTASLDYPHTLLESAILLLVLKMNRKVTQKIIFEYPASHKFFNQAALNTFTISSPLSDILKNLMIIETYASINLLKMVVVDPNTLFEKNSLISYLPNFITKTFLKENATLNLISRQYLREIRVLCQAMDQKNEVCESTNSMINYDSGPAYYNPIGKYAMDLIMPNVARALKKVVYNHRELSLSFSIDSDAP